ncbi:MAG: hypothetical protein ACRD1T_14200, partial [Acidimicrobiia bacterium]
MYKWSSDRWNSNQTQLWQVYVKSIGTYSTMEKHYNCVPRDPIRDNAAGQSKSPSPALPKDTRIQGAVQSTPSGFTCTWSGADAVFLARGVVRRYQGGKITEERDANGNVTTFGYTTFADGIGSYPSIVTDPVGRQIVYSYAPAYQKCVKWGGQENAGECEGWKWVYQVSSVRDPYGRTATYTNDGAGKIVAVTNAAGKTTQYTYATGNLLGTLPNPRGNATNIEWTFHTTDSKYRVTRVTAPGSAETKYAYTVTADANGVHRVTRTIVTNALNRDTTYNMYAGTDSNYFGNLERVTDPLGNTTQYAYDARHNLTVVTDPLGNRTTYQYNSKNRVTLIVQAAGPEGSLNLATSFTWLLSVDNINENLSSVTNPLSVRTDFTYNAAHKLASVKRAVGKPEESLTQYTYFPWGGLESVKDPQRKDHDLHLYSP